MLAGIPGSGKSTYAEKMKNEYENIVVCSSDAIREELTGNVNNQDLNEEVFKVLHRRVKDNLKAGNNVIYDACNISSRRRRHFVQTELKGI
jgi:predicted kinase